MTEAEFDYLYGAVSRPLLGYLLRRGVSAEDAADLLAEVMTIAWARRADLPPPAERAPWLFGVARNLLAVHHRGGARRQQLVERLAETLAAVPIQAVQLQPDASRLDLHRALRRLRPMDAEIVTLAAWEGFTSIEIGTMLGLPAETVRTRMRRARAKLRAELGLDLEAIPIGVSVTPTTDSRCQ